MSRHTIATVSEKMRRMGCNGDEDNCGNKSGSKYAVFHGKGHGCRIIDVVDLRKRDGTGQRGSCKGLNVAEKCMTSSNGCCSAETRPRRSANGGTDVDCSLQSMIQSFTTKTKEPENEEGRELKGMITSQHSCALLPDHILELCLVRSSFATLMNARLVCKKWKTLTSMPQFMQMRYASLYRSPWLFVFGGSDVREIHALDVSHGRWHRIDTNILKGRSLFSIASVGSSIYVVGGQSAINGADETQKMSFRTLKGVLVFCPFLGTWSKAAPMRTARSTPVLGVIEVDADKVSSSQGCDDNRLNEFDRDTVSRETYDNEDTLVVQSSHQLRHLLSEPDTSSNPPFSDLRRCESSTEKDYSSKLKMNKRFFLIAVGGKGPQKEPLSVAEMYDPVFNTWTQIASLPSDFGNVRSGAVCNGKFYVYSEFDKLAAFNIATGMWVAIDIGRTPPHLHEYCPRLVSCNGRLFMLFVSWSDREDQFHRHDRAVRKLWQIDVLLNRWKEISRHPDAPLDLDAVFVADGEMIYGLEMFKIFGQMMDFLTVCRMSDSVVKWSHISRKQFGKDLDPSSCSTKSMVVLNL